MRLVTRGRLGWASALLFGAGVVAAAGFPTGASAATGVVPPGARVAAQQRVGAVRVLAVVHTGRLRAEVAYHGAKGWFGVLLDRPPGGGAPIAWTSTAGGGPIPALSAVYGQATPGAARVVVRWHDGRVTTAPVGGDAFVAARLGARRAAVVRFVDAGGAVLGEVPAP